jgi:hypothetical protein
MSKPTTITLDSVEYVRADSLPAGEPTPVQIVVIEGRWNIVGNVSRNDDGSLTIANANVIRYWGTTKGLGQLAESGPTSKTILDKAGTVRTPAHSVLLTIDVATPEKWSL